MTNPDTLREAVARIVGEQCFGRPGKFKCEQLPDASQADAYAAADAIIALLNLSEIEGVLEPFSLVPEVGKRGGRFLIARASYMDGTAPRAAHLHWDQFANARTLLLKLKSMRGADA